MKCWIFNQYINTPDSSGGSRHYELARELAGNGNDIVLFGALKRKNEKTYFLENQEGFKIVWFNMNTYFGKSVKRIFNMFLYSFLLLAFFTKRKSFGLRKPDIIIGSSVHPFGAYAAFILSRIYSVPFVFEIRDLWPQTLIDMGAITPRHPLALFMKLLEMRMCEKSVLIVSLLPFAYEYICSRYDVIPEKVKWLPNGVNLDMFPLQGWPDANDNISVTYFGAHGNANALDTIIDAINIMQSKSSKRILLRLIGQGQLKDALIKKVENLGLENVEFLEPIPKKELYKIARYTHAFIVNLRDLPLYNYGISLNKIYDYMAMARPVIIGCSARNNPVEETSAGITVPADNAEQLATALLRLENISKDEMVAMGNNGRLYVEKNNSYLTLSLQFEEWLSQSLVS